MLSQTDRMVKLMRSQPVRGVTNWELSQISLKYSSRIAELRQDGLHVQAVRQKLPNGKWSNTWRYYLVESSKPDTKNTGGTDGIRYERTENSSNWLGKKVSRLVHRNI